MRPTYEVYEMALFFFNWPKLYFWRILLNRKNLVNTFSIIAATQRIIQLGLNVRADVM